MTSDDPVEKLQRQLYSLGMSTSSNLGQSVAPATPVEPKDTSANVTGEITGGSGLCGCIFGCVNLQINWTFCFVDLK